MAGALERAGRARPADLVVTGEGAFELSSCSGEVPYSVAQIAEAALRPCGGAGRQVPLGSREMRALGVESAHSLVDMVGEERTFAELAEALVELAGRVARTWSR